MHKKIKLALIIVASVTVIGTGIWFGVQKFNRTKVEVYRVEELKQMIWGESSSLEGIIFKCLTESPAFRKSDCTGGFGTGGTGSERGNTTSLRYDTGSY